VLGGQRRCCQVWIPGGFIELAEWAVTSKINNRPTPSRARALACPSHGGERPIAVTHVTAGGVPAVQRQCTSGP
jgi:hypothetical protein